MVVPKVGCLALRSPAIYTGDCLLKSGGRYVVAIISGGGVRLSLQLWLMSLRESRLQLELQPRPFAH